MEHNRTHRQSVTVDPAFKSLVPNYIRIQAEGTVDPIFGCPRQKYLQLEKEGHLKLVRLVPRGKRRGIVLVPVADMSAHLEALRAK